MDEETEVAAAHLARSLSEDAPWSPRGTERRHGVQSDWQCMGEAAHEEGSECCTEELFGISEHGDAVWSATYASAKRATGIHKGIVEAQSFQPV